MMNGTGSASSLLSFDLQSSYASHVMRLNDEVVNASEVPAFLRSHRRKKETESKSDQSIESSTSFASSISLSLDDYSDNDVEQDDEQKQESEVPNSKAFYIPGITAKARCLEGSSTGTTNSIGSTSTPRQRRVGSSRESSSQYSINSACSSSSRGSRTKRGEVPHSRAKSLDTCQYNPVR